MCISQTAARSACLVVLLPLALAGCSSTSEPTQPNDPLAASQGTGAVADLTKASCTPDAKGVWHFTGTVKNSRDAAATYTVTASVVKKTGGTVVVDKQFVKRLEPGKSASYDKQVVGTAKPVKDLSCVTSVRAK